MGYILEQSFCSKSSTQQEGFIKTMTNRLALKQSMRLLNVASGPARDIAELYAIIQPKQLSTVCVEADKTAIAYAKNVNKANADQLEFVHQNIFRFTAKEQFDMVWSAGLCGLF